MARPRMSKLPKPLPEGFTLADTGKKRWRLGRIIGQGGFGLIYLASQDVDSAVAEDTGFVIKVEYHENGPLFSELKFYQRAAKAETIQGWIKRRKLSFLGVPAYWGAGLAEHNGLRYRFMAMQRLGTDLQEVCSSNGGRLQRTAVLQIGLQLLDVLEYIHDNEYVHADIKAANLMLGYTDPEKVYLADYGLAYRYCPGGVHTKYVPNPKRCHNGTIEYTSLDAHIGAAPTRRGDLQVLGFCMLHWLCGTLPWVGMLKNASQVQEAKARLMDNLPGSVQKLSASGAATDEVGRFLLYVQSLDYLKRPDYGMLRDLLAGGGQGPLDLSKPRGCHAAGAPEEPLPRGKAGPPKRPAKPKTGAVLSDKEDEGAGGSEVTKAKPSHVPKRKVATNPRTEQKAGRGTARPEATEPKEEEQRTRKTKPIPSQYLRGPPINRPEASGKATTAKRSTRARSGPIEVDQEDSESDDDEDREEEWLPIEACPRPKRTPVRKLHNGRGESPVFNDLPRGRGRGQGLRKWEEPSPGTRGDGKPGVGVMARKVCLFGVALRAHTPRTDRPGGRAGRSAGRCTPDPGWRSPVDRHSRCHTRR